MPSIIAISWRDHGMPTPLSNKHYLRLGRHVCYISNNSCVGIITEANDHSWAYYTNC